MRGLLNLSQNHICNARARQLVPSTASLWGRSCRVPF